MKLADYLKSNGLTQAEFAQRVGVTQFAVSKWMRGGGMDSRRLRQVVAATDGQVSPHDLAPELFPAGFQFPADPAPVHEQQSEAAA